MRSSWKQKSSKSLSQIEEKSGKNKNWIFWKTFCYKKNEKLYQTFLNAKFFWRFHSIFIVFSFASIKMMSLCSSETLGVSALSFQKEIPSAELQRTWYVEALSCIRYSISSPGFPASTFSALSSLDLSQKFEPPQVPFAH